MSSYCRQENQHGGAAIFLSEDIQGRELVGVRRLSVKGVVECAAAQCNIGERSFSIVSIYRGQHNIHAFLSRFEVILSRLFGMGGTIFIAGDFNIDMLKDSQEKEDFASLLESFGLKILISEWTRCDRVTGRYSCLDNFLTNYPEECNAVVLHASISDHTTQKVSFRYKVSKDNKTKKLRVYSEQNKIKFLNYLENQNWEEVYSLDQKDVDKQWEVFINIFLKGFNSCFPLQTKKIKKKHVNTDWYSDPEIEECKNRLDIFNVMSQFDTRYVGLHKQTKQQYDKLLLTSRAGKYEKQLNESDNKSKCLWSIYRSITGESKSRKDSPFEGDAQEIVEECNNYLIQIMPKLLGQLRSVPFTHNICSHNKSLFLRKLTPDDIFRLSKKIKNKHSSGDDEIPASLIKLCIHEIKHILTYIINASFKWGVFPEQLKTALIRLVHKKGDKNVIDNYRPISLLCSFSKLFELAMCERLVQFLQDYNILSINQHGYIPNCSTETAIYQFTCKILGALERGELALGMFLDLSRAYDSLDHELLLMKLERYGVRGKALKWFRSYLTGRNQRVGINKNGQEYKSSLKPISFGVPQGSIIGPILFVVYINDLYDALNNSVECITSYADDTSLLVSAAACPGLTEKGNGAFCSADDWFAANKLILNKRKTNLVCFKTKQCNRETPVQLTLAGETVLLSNHVKFLGIHIDESLDWSQQISCLCAKLNSICYCGRIVRRYLNDKCLRTIYFACFHSLMRYGVIFWGNSSGINRVFVVQKRMIRIMFGMKVLESCRGVFRRHNVLTVYGTFIYECLIFLFKNKKDFEDSVVHSHDTRTLDLTYPKHRLTMSEKCAHYMCIKLYNTLPTRLRIEENFCVFKRQVKQLLVELEPYTMSEFFDGVKTGMFAHS